MPNNSLYGKEYPVPSNVLSALNKSNSQRSGNIVNNRKISYSLLKRLKHDFDYLDPGSEEYESYGGDTVKNWVNEILRNNRSDVHDIKQNQMNTGMFNRFKKTHNKDKNANPTQISGIDTTHKEFLRENDIYNKTNNMKKKIIRLRESQLKRIIENIILKEDDERHVNTDYRDFVVKFDLNATDSPFRTKSEIIEALKYKFGDDIRNITIDGGYVED